MQFVVGPSDKELETWPQVTYACVSNIEAEVARQAEDNYWNIEVDALTPSSPSFLKDRAVFVDRLNNMPMRHIADSQLYQHLGWLLKVTCEEPDPDPETTSQVRVGSYISATRFLGEVTTTAYNLTSAETYTLLPATFWSEFAGARKAKIDLKPNFEGAMANFAKGKTRGIDALLKRA